MDEILSERYMALFLAYGVGERSDLTFIKSALLARTHPKFLRPDAALLLLTLFDQMILRPYTGPIPPLTPDPGDRQQLLPLPNIARNESYFSTEVVRRSLDEILKKLEDLHHEVSSQRSAQGNFEQLADDQRIVWMESSFLCSSAIRTARC